MREDTARDEWRAAYINTNDNKFDILTNTLPHGEEITEFCKMLLHHICRDSSPDLSLKLRFNYFRT